VLSSTLVATICSTPLQHPSFMIDHMPSDTAPTILPPLSRGGGIPSFLPIGTVVDRWDCPCCDRVIELVHRAGRPRLYCSQACRQRAYRWRRQHHVHTPSSPSWPAERASVRRGGRQHALRTERDPMSARRDRRGREVSVCGVLAHPSRHARAAAHRDPFLHDVPSSSCRTCAALTSPRPLGLVPPGAGPADRPGSGRFAETVRALRAISDGYPLDPVLRHLLVTSWAA
jgi:hypothetical protein